METSFPKDKIKILLLEGIHPVAVETFKRADYTNVELLSHALSEDDLIEKLQDVRLVGLRSKTQLTARVLEAADKLMGVGCFCIGTNQVDLEKAKDLGIAVFNSPYSNTRSVAELVVAQTVFLMRGIPEKNAAAHLGKWMKSAADSYEVRGKTLGIVGYGHIGSQVSVLAEGMGCKVIFYDIEPKLPMGNAIAVDSMDELLAESDVVTLHVPADDSTYMMMNKAEIAKMKKGAALINLARGSVVEIDSLREALEAGDLSGAAVDVFPVEPKSKEERFNSPLQDLPQVILTPHIGGSTQEAQYNIGKDAASKLINYLDKGSTVGSHSVPPLNLPVVKGAHRILHIHQNVPGVLNAINKIMAEMNINILGQYLKTNEKIGYVVLDIAANKSDALADKLRDVPNTISTRILY